MTKNRSSSILLAAAIAALSALAVDRSAFAQYPAGQDGHANDANTRAGSGGYNTQRPQSNVVTGNDIANRNVSGGWAFRGPIGERDPQAFRGPVSGTPSDRFVRNSAGVPTGAGVTNNLTRPQVYYGENRGVAPPAGSVPEGFSGGYVGTTIQSPTSMSNSLNTAVGSTGLQSRVYDRDTFLLNSAINPSGYPGVNDVSTENGLLTASPLFGIRQLGAGEINSFNNTLGGVELPDRLGGRTQPQTLAGMRQELQDAAEGLNGQGINGQGRPSSPFQVPGQNNANNPNHQGRPGTQQQQNGTEQGPTEPLSQTLGSPNNGAIENRVNAQVGNGALASAVTLPEGGRGGAAGMLPTPAQQSTVLQTLQDRLRQYEGSNQSLAQQPGAPRPQQQPGRTGTAAANGNKGTTGTTPLIAPVPPANGAVPEGPMKVSSLATGIKAKGLHDMLAGAEELMRQGKFESAIERFGQAQRVAPNNPLIPLGRAHAELAAGEYSQADQDLRMVFRNDPELLLAQFDLPGVIPADRLQFVRKDLESLTQSDAKSARPYFLLAYVDYNSGDAAGADKNLDEAEKRAGRADWAIRLLRQHWTLPSNANKPAPTLPGRPAGAQRGAPPAAPARTQTPEAPVGGVAPSPTLELNK